MIIQRSVIFTCMRKSTAQSRLLQNLYYFDVTCCANFAGGVMKSMLDLLGIRSSHVEDHKLHNVKDITSGERQFLKT